MIRHAGFWKIMGQLHAWIMSTRSIEWLSGVAGKAERTRLPTPVTKALVKLEPVVRLVDQIGKEISRFVKYLPGLPAGENCRPLNRKHSVTNLARYSDGQQLLSDAQTDKASDLASTIVISSAALNFGTGMVLRQLGAL